MTDIFKLLASDGDMLDSISGDYEDSFSLDSFKDICNAHWEMQKSFIIARVQTVDPKQPDKEFYSYYDAFHLNKILFQTQIVLKKKYIHRLHVLNPLTNTDIIGNVQYFLLKPNSSYTAPPMANEKPASHLDGFDVTSPSVKAIERGEKINWTFNNHQVRAEDDRGVAAVLDEKFAAPLIRKNDIIQYSIENIFPKSVPKTKKRHSLTLTASFPLEQPIVNQCEKTELSPGQITQFSNPIALDKLIITIPKTNSGNRRALSYRNAVSASTAPVSFLEWSNLIEKEKELGLNTADFYDELDLSLVLPATSIGESASTLSLFYDGVLFATDDDYLSSSKIRKVFYENALTLEDAKLFEMKEFTGEVEELPQVERRSHSEISLCCIQ